MSPLDAKLARDLWRMKGQAAAIGAVIGVGVMLLVMMTGLVASLSETRAAYYDRYRMAEVFAPVTRAPERLAARLAEIPGVSAVRTRVTGRALIDLPGHELPVQAQAVPLPERGRAPLNDIHLSEGRLPATGHADEILLLRGFARAHGIVPGDTLTATMNGARRTFRVTGLAESPEFLYTTVPGELVPDDARFGVIWMTDTALAAAYDMEGAFNEALMILSRGASAEAVEAAADRILAPYGGTGAYDRSGHMSDRFVTEEIAGLRRSAAVVPPVFLAVAAFLLNIVVGRMVQSEREEIGLLKAFGYTNAEVGSHYFKLILAIAAGGAAAGCLAGIGAGRWMVGIYVDYFKFPFLVFRLDPAAFVAGVSVSILAASAGGLLVLRRVFALAPADAMRPPAPPDYSRSGRIGLRLGRFLDQPSRMVLRRLTRQPVRMLGATTGIACGMALSAAMLTIYAGFDRTIALTFDVMDRSDMRVSFTHALSQKALAELGRIPGVQRVEGVREVPAVLRNGRHSYRGALTGLPRDAALNRALDDRAEPLAMPEEGVVVSVALADILRLTAGDVLTVEIREGRQPVLHIPVTGIANTLLGAPAYMEMAALNRALDAPRRVSAAHLTVDAARAGRIYATLKDMPTVAGVSVKSEARAAFVRLMDTGAGATRYLMGTLAFIITFGIVYNAARVALAERSRDLASLRVMGFTNGEAAFVLLGELAVVTLIALPAGAVLGYWLSHAIAAGFSTDLYQIPVVWAPASFGDAMLVVLGAALVSGWLVKRDLDRTDPATVLKTAE